MELWAIGLIIIVSILLFLCIGVCISIYFFCFYNYRKKKVLNQAADELPFMGPQTSAYKDELKVIYKNARELPFQSVYIKSFDHKSLHGKLYIKDLNRPFIILCHGYTGGGLRDFSSHLLYLLEQNYNCLLISQRSHELSSGRSITYGVKEHKDIIRWSNYIDKNYRPKDIFLYGISMGGASVLMCANKKLNKSVKGIIADCPFTCPKDIIFKVMNQINAPVNLFKPFTYISAFIFAHFRLNKEDARISVKETKLPILIIHGEDDEFVPCYMGEELYCMNKKMVKFIKIPLAGHSQSFIVNKECYTNNLNEFLKENSN
jgi:pimeloyl-ACP methyl ester carboxylesterase